MLYTLFFLTIIALTKIILVFIFPKKVELLTLSFIFTWMLPFILLTIPLGLMYDFTDYDIPATFLVIITTIFMCLGIVVLVMDYRTIKKVIKDPSYMDIAVKKISPYLRLKS